MTTARLVLGLAWRNLRGRPGAPALLLVAVATATLTLAAALSIGSGAATTWTRLFTRTGGAQIVATADQPGALTPLLHARGAVGALGPVTLLDVTADIDGRPVRLRVAGRDSLGTPIDHPLLTAGSADLSAAGIVVDRNVAAAAGARVGDPVRVAGYPLTLRGTAVSTAQEPFPYQGPGLAWVSPDTAELLAVAAAGQPGFHQRYQVELRLSAATDAAGFLAAQHLDPAIVQAQTWLDIRTATTIYLRVVGAFLLTASGLLALLAGCGMTVLVATRMDQRLRQVGTLKAIGATPGQVVLVALAEHAAVAVLATAIGLTAGVPIAGWLGRRASTAIGLPDASGLSWRAALAVCAAAVVAVLLAGARPAWRAVRDGTLSDLATVTRPPRHASLLARAATAARLPLPATLGLRSLARRPARTVLTTCSLILAVAMGTTALILQAVSRRFPTTLAGDPPGDAFVDRANRTLLHELQDLIVLFALLFVLLGVVNVVLVATAAARDAASNQAVLQAVGLTPAQAVASLVTTQMIPATIGAIVGIPIGTVLFRGLATADGTLDPGTPTSLTPLAAVVLALTTLAVCGLLAAVPAGALARRGGAALLTTD